MYYFILNIYNNTQRVSILLHILFFEGQTIIINRKEIYLMNNKKKNNKKPKIDIEEKLAQENIVSSTGSTGMISKPPTTDGELEGYSDIHHVPQKKHYIKPNKDAGKKKS